MSSDCLSISGGYELLALHRGLMEARFCRVPNDPDVSGSPLLAKIHRDVVRVLIESSSPPGGTASQWKSWLRIDEQRREWAIAVERARTSSWWAKMSSAQKEAAVLDLLAPFDVGPDLVERFLDAVDS